MDEAEAVSNDDVGSKERLAKDSPVVVSAYEVIDAPGERVKEGKPVDKVEIISNEDDAAEIIKPSEA